MLGGTMACGFAGLVLVCGGFAVVLPDPYVFWLLGIPAATFLACAWIWPSYRIGAAGVTAFWSLPFAGAMAPLISYYGVHIILEGMPFLFMVIAISMPWSMLCITFTRLRLPIVYPPGCCQKCGYSLRGLHHARCPECGSISGPPNSP